MNGIPYLLVVEDDDDLRESMAELLEDAGFTTLTAEHGADALRVIAERGAPKLILLDLVMKVMDGWTFLSRLRGVPSYASIPVIVTTSGPARAPAGVVVLEKPVDPELLERHIQRYLRAS